MMLIYIISLLPAMLEGLYTTLQVFMLTMLLSLPLGLFVALGRLCRNKYLHSILQFYIWIMRGTPLMLQLVFIFFGLPIVGITFDRFDAAIIAFVLNYGAYFGEIFRAGIQSIDKGQYEAAKVLGFSPVQALRIVILPQVWKRVLPPVSNEVITMIKDTSLVYVVGLGEILRAGKIASNRDASLVPLIVSAIFYLVLTAILTKLFKLWEDKYAYYQ